MNIAIVQSTWTPHSDARIAKLIERFSDRHNISVVTVAGSQSDYGWPAPELGRDALFPEMDYWSISPSRIKREVPGALSALDPEVVVLPGWVFPESLGGLRWAADRHKARVLVSDSHRDDVRRTWLKERMKRLLVSSFDAALVGGSRHVDYLVTLGFDAERCFPGCDVVNNSHFTASRKSGSVPTLLSCIRLLNKKNVPFVLDVLASDNSGWHWRIAGDGPARDQIEKRVRELGLTSKVSLLGHVDYARLPEVYASADVYVQPSLSEPWGLAVNEAMAAGLPVLVSNRCGCSTDLVVEGENGYLFDPISADSLVGYLAWFADKRERWKEMGEASRRIIASWDLDFYATNLIKACEVALADPGKSLVSRVVARAF